MQIVPFEIYFMHVMIGGEKIVYLYLRHLDDESYFVLKVGSHKLRVLSTNKISELILVVESISLIARTLVNTHLAAR
jgi:hypothetical protein